MTDKNIVFNYNRKSWKETLDFIGTLNSGHILDLGCGNGSETAILCKKGLNVTALDVSDDLINEAKKKAPEAKYIKADIIKKLNYELKETAVEDIVFRLGKVS